MSLRLPSQNKFRPTAKPGLKKTGPRPNPPRPPSQPQPQKATPSAAAIPATQASSNAGPSSSASQITSAATPADPSSLSSQTVVAGPSSSATQAVSQTSTIVPSQLPPPKDPVAAQPKPISSAQVQAIRSSNPSSTTARQPSAPQAAEPSDPSASSAPQRDPPSVPPVSPTAPPPPQAKPINTPALTEASIAKNPNPEPSTSASSAPAPRPSAPAQKLSLLDAARNHSSNAPSPGSIRRGTPSLSARSMRAPSMTPTPGRAPSVTPQPQRAPSITPQPQRAPSASPHPQRAPSASPRPQSQRPPSSDAHTRREPSSTPQPPAPSSSFPPSLGISTAPSFGFPPSLGTTTAAGPSRASSVTPAPPDTAAMAAALVSSITGPQVPAQPPRKGKRRITKGRAQPAKGSVPDDSMLQQQASRPSRPRKTPGSVRAGTEDGATSEEEEGSQNESGDQEDDAGDGELDENGKRKSGTGNGTKRASRPSKRVRLQRPKPPTVARISLQEMEPDEMVGDKVDEVVITMGDLATTLAAQGKVSQRAIKIDEFKRNELLQKRAASRLRAEHNWRRNQIKRRKVRATKNRDRARRRERLGQLGMDEGAVSPDEEDSDEEYEPEPERLTPESTPEPDHGRMNSQAPERAEGEEDDDDVETVQGREDWEMDFEAENREGEAGEEGDFLGGAGSGDEHGAAEAEEDEDMAALRAAGFLVTEDQENGQNGFGEGEDGDDGEYGDDDEPWLRGDEPDIEGYRQALEQRRRRVIEDHDRDDQEIVEVDDETRFINSASFSNKTRPQRWTTVDTELFYQVLEETGENYTLMKAYFPGRTVKQLKLKGLRENRSNSEKMTAAIMARKPLDKDYLTKAAGYDSTRAWDREEALFEEARADADKLRRLDSLRPGEGDGDGEGEDGELGNVTFDIDDNVYEGEAGGEGDEYKDDEEDKGGDDDDGKEDDNDENQGEGEGGGVEYHGDDKSGDEDGEGY
ncbi:hypothetical protein IAU59_006589 [Kwoniella sp. CBS 9459]